MLNVTLNLFQIFHILYVISAESMWILLDCMGKQSNKTGTFPAAFADELFCLSHRFLQGKEHIFLNIPYTTLPWVSTILPHKDWKRSKEEKGRGPDPLDPSAYETSYWKAEIIWRHLAKERREEYSHALDEPVVD